MSFRIQPAAPARPNRCQLFGPGSRPAIFEKMATSAADVINIDLEDSVAPDDKATARKNTIEAIGDVDWGNKTLSVRINGLDSPYWYRDVVDLLENASDRLDQIMIPKVGCAADVYAVDALVTSIEAAKGRTKPISFELIIEKYEEFFNDEILQKKKYLRDLSKGNQKKAGIIAALIGNPDVVILDEPFANLDPTTQIRLKKIIKELNQHTDITILISSHDLIHVTEVCERIVVLDKGETVKDIQTSQATLEELEAYFNR